MKPLASIILPTYNRAYCLPEVIDSLLAQTYEAFEVVVVDDGSTDDTAALMKSRYGCDARVRYVARENGGCSAARNTGMACARGDVLVFCDSDDIWRPEKLALQMAAFAHFPDVNLVWTDITAVDSSRAVLHERYTRVCYPAWKEGAIDQLFDRSESLTVLCPQFADRVGSDRVYAGDIFQTMIVGTLVNMPSVAVRATLVDAIGGFDETMATGEDYDFNLRACSASPAAFIDWPTVLYRVGAPDQLTRPSLHVDQARNYFRAVAPFLAGTGRPIHLTRAKLDSVLAGKYHWLGASELHYGERRAARTALWRSIRHGNRRPGVFAQLGMSIMPAPTGFKRSLRALYRRLKSARAVRAGFDG